MRTTEKLDQEGAHIPSATPLYLLLTETGLSLNSVKSDKIIHGNCFLMYWTVWGEWSEA